MSQTDKRRAYFKAYYRVNRAKLIKQQREYKAANRDKVLEAQREREWRRYQRPDVRAKKLTYQRAYYRQKKSAANEGTLR
jgi:hypothetical protein